MEGRKEFRKWKRDQWIAYLADERSGGRTTLSHWLGAIIAVTGAFVAVLVGLKDIEDFDVIQLVVGIFVWIYSVVVAATYVWYQYLGAVRGISRNYFSPKVRSDRTIGRLIPLDCSEILWRDVGILLEVLFGRPYDLREPIKPNQKERQSILRWVDAARVLFGATIGLSLGAIVFLTFHSLGLFPYTWPMVFFALAGAAAASTGFSIRGFCRKTAKVCGAQRGGILAGEPFPGD